MKITFRFLLAGCFFFAVTPLVSADAFDGSLNPEAMSSIYASLKDNPMFAPDRIDIAQQAAGNGYSAIAFQDREAGIFADILKSLGDEKTPAQLKIAKQTAAEFAASGGSRTALSVALFTSAKEFPSIPWEVRLQLARGVCERINMRWQTGDKIAAAYRVMVLAGVAYQNYYSGRVNSLSSTELNDLVAISSAVRGSKDAALWFAAPYASLSCFGKGSPEIVHKHLRTMLSDMEAQGLIPAGAKSKATLASKRKQAAGAHS